MSVQNETPLTVDTSCETFQLSDRFCDVHALSYGSSGLVLSAFDAKLKKKVAVKRVLLANRSRKAVREVKFIRQLNHENIVEILDVLGQDCETVEVEESSLGQLSCIHLVEDCLDTDLNSLIQGRQLDENHAKWFLYQTLRGVRYIHSANLIHRDLKPSSLLVNSSNLQLKITNFSSCRVIDPDYDHSGYLTECVGSCWYRSPEQILTPKHYSSTVDLWSVGCLLAEMLLGRPLFAGADELNQMMLFLDTVHLEEVDWGQVLHVMPNKMLKNHPFRPRMPLAEQFTDIDADALDLLEQLLRFNAHERWSAERALQHGYLSEYASGEGEPTAPIQYHIEQEVADADELTLPSTDAGRLVVSETEGSQSSAEVSSPSRGLLAPPHSLPMVVLEETHTLDEILHLSDEETSTNTLSGSIGDCSSKSTSVEDLNLRNLRNSQENLYRTPSSQNILSLSDEEPLLPRHTGYTSGTSSQHTGVTVSNNNTTTTTIATSTTHIKPYREDDDKDIAEISVEKQAEDAELEALHSAVGCYKEEEEVLSVSHEGGSDSDRSAFAVDCYKELRVNLQVTENYKEYSQVSPKQVEDRRNEGQVGGDVHYPSAKPKVSARPTQSGRENPDDGIQEKKLLEFYNKHRLSSKFEAEKKENEKIKKKRLGRNNRGGHNSDLDEMYRLPTEHLCTDRHRDYSNERIKQRNLVKMQRQCLARYRDEINEINERLKEASLDGAVGGVDIPEESPSDLHGLTVLDPGPRGTGVDYVNNQRMLAGERQRRSQNDTGFSSPEDNPSSPRASFSSGARPKKSPRKQKAL